MDSYSQFIASKSRYVDPVGFEPRMVSERLYPFQCDLTRWAARLGRAGIFADCGMGKTPMQLEWARLVHEHTNKNVLILAPLAVGKQTAREAERFGIEARYCRKGFFAQDGITITNYEMIEHFNPADFVGVVLDESSILKSYSGATRNKILEAFSRTPYRLACTATPAPNDFMELGNHAEFFGVQTHAEMLSMFFVHDGGSTQDWRLKGHAEAEFWRWVCRWAAMIRRPSDLGYDDGAFVLPPLNFHEHVVGVDHVTERKAGLLFAMEAHTLAERRAARCASIEDRVAKASELASQGGQWLVWCNLNDESKALAAEIPDAVEVTGSDEPEKKEEAMLRFAEGSIRVLVSKPSICGFGMNFQRCSNVAFVGLSDSYEQFYQAIRRCWRFGQTRPVEAHVITSELEGAVVTNIKRKEEDAERMAVAMVASMREVMQASMRGTRRDATEYEPAAALALPAWLLQSEGA
jgi:superfamily II DNA or RNA helicase